MSLGFSVDSLLPKARGGGQLRMGLVKLEESEWLQPQPDLAARAAGFAEEDPSADLTGLDAAAKLAHQPGHGHRGVVDGEADFGATER